jgi:hypothetical protein
VWYPTIPASPKVVVIDENAGLGEAAPSAKIVPRP